MIKLHKFCMAAAVALAAGAVFAIDVYRNDFGTRTSEGAIPGDRWMSYDYIQSRNLYNNYGSNEGVPNAFWSRQSEFQDGWVKARMDSETMQSPPGFGLATDPDHGSADNPFALFRSSTSRSGCAVQPLHNEFTNGTIRFEIDIRRPSVWATSSTETHTVRAMLVYRKYMDLVWNVGVNNTQYPVMFGAAWDGGSAKNRLALHRTDTNGTRSVFNPGASAGYVCNDNWYRWRVYVNLDRQYCTCYIWDTGGNQPDGPNTMADSTATRKVELKDTYLFADPMTEETGGIAGIGLNAYRFKSGTGDGLNVTNAPCFDNIYLAWKAPDSSTYVPFYENNFTTRRFRRIQPTPAASVAYPVNADVSSVDIFSSYVAAASNAADNASLTLLVNNDPGLIGMDNWSRLVGSNSRIAIIDSKTDGGKMLRASTTTSNSGNGVVAQTLDETITSGKVRISGDVRLPSEWRIVTSADARVCLALGSDAYWLSNSDTYMSRHIGYGAIVGETADEFRPAYLPQSGGLVTTKSADVTCTPTNWYRLVVTADMDTRKYDYELYALGPDAGKIDRKDVPAEPIYATNGIAFRNTPSTLPNIGSFSLFSFRGGTNWNTYILWDNIRVWKDWDSTNGTGTLIYSNDFYDRKRYVAREKTELLHGTYTGIGVDAWEQVNRGEGTAWIMGDTNRFLSLKAQEGASLYGTQPLPAELPCGRRVTFRVDVRPPCWWLDSGHFNVYLGGDEMLQYSDASDSRPLNDSVMSFGLYPASKSLGRYTNSLFRVQNGVSLNSLTGVPQIQSDHWYRLEGSTVSGSGTWRFRAYDMGTTHPEIDAPNGPVVASVDGLARRSSGATSGISAIAFGTGGIPSLEPWDLYDRGRLQMDNIVVTAFPSGTWIIVR